MLAQRREDEQTNPSGGQNSDAARILLSLWLSQQNFGIWGKIGLAPTLDASVNEIRYMGQRWIGANTRIHHRLRVLKFI